MRYATEERAGSLYRQAETIYTAINARVVTGDGKTNFDLRYTVSSVRRWARVCGQASISRTIFTAGVGLPRRDVIAVT